MKKMMKGIEYAFMILILYSFNPYLLDHFLWTHPILLCIISNLGFCIGYYLT